MFYFVWTCKEFRYWVLLDWFYSLWTSSSMKTRRIKFKFIALFTGVRSGRSFDLLPNASSSIVFAISRFPSKSVLPLSLVLLNGIPIFIINYVWSCSWEMKLRCFRMKVCDVVGTFLKSIENFHICSNFCF